MAGTLRELSSYFISGPFTHVLLYAGDETFVHSQGNGVQSISTYEVLEKYDTLAITRPYTEQEHVINNAVDYAKSKEGTPFDFAMLEGEDALYCSELIALAYEKSGLNMPTAKPQNKTLIHRLLGVNAIHPQDFLEYGEEVFLSHNLEESAGKISYAS